MKHLQVNQVFNDAVAIEPGAEHPKAYKVTKVTNATAPHIYDVLQPEELQPYCDSEKWDVIIT